jgi:hypothetical protein
MVLITFSLAQEDSKKMEQLYSGSRVSVASQQIANQFLDIKMQDPATGTTNTE